MYNQPIIYYRDGQLLRVKTAISLTKYFIKQKRIYKVIVDSSS